MILELLKEVLKTKYGCDDLLIARLLDEYPDIVKELKLTEFSSVNIVSFKLMDAYQESLK
jgi:hypothetical protein